MDALATVLRACGIAEEVVASCVANGVTEATALVKISANGPDAMNAVKLSVEIGILPKDTAHPAGAFRGVMSRYGSPSVLAE
jgi:hypothetical protein